MTAFLPWFHRQIPSRIWTHRIHLLICLKFSYLEQVRWIRPFHPFCSRIEYIADTDNNTIVRQYIVSTLRALNWHVEEDSFTDNTPIGLKRFTNVVATKDPTASRRIILSAHFDSKYYPTFPQNQVRISCHSYSLLGAPCRAGG